jgi:putative transposase
MKKPRFSEQQIAVALRQAEQGTTAGEICRKLGVSEATFYAWKKRYEGLVLLCYKSSSGLRRPAT